MSQPQRDITGRMWKAQSIPQALCVTENLSNIYWKLARGVFFPFSHSLNVEKFSHTAKGRVRSSTALQHCVLLWKKGAFEPRVWRPLHLCALSESIYKSKVMLKQCVSTESWWETQVYSFCSSFLWCSYLLSSSQRVIWVTITACARNN